MAKFCAHRAPLFAGSRIASYISLRPSMKGVCSTLLPTREVNPYHLLGHKSPRRKRQYSKLLVLTGKDARRLRRAAPYLKDKD